MRGGVPVTAVHRRDESEFFILKAVADGAAAEEVFERVALLIEERLPGAMCSLLRLDPATGRLVYVAAPNLPDEYVRIDDGLLPGPRRGSCGTAAWLAEPVFANDIATDENWAGFRDIAEEFGLRSCWSAPLFSGRGELLGTLAVYYSEPRCCSDGELVLIESSIHLASIAMQHASTSEALEARDRLIRGTAEAMSLLITEGDVRLALPRTLAILGRAANVDRVYFFEYHPHPESGEQVASQRAEWARGAVESQLDHPGMQAFSMVGLFPEWDAALKRGESVAADVDDLDAEPQAFLSEQDIRSVLLVPVIVADRLWGFLGFDACQGKRAWGEAERAALQSTAGALGAAYSRARAEEQLLHANQRFEGVAANTPGVIFQCRVGVDLTLDFTYISGGANEIFGRDLTVLQDRPEMLSDMIHPDDVEGFWRTLGNSLSAGASWSWEGRGFDDEGRIHWVSATGRFAHQEDGVYLCHGLLLDVTKHRENELALTQNRRRLAAIFENALDGIILADDEGRYLDANPAACDMVGCSLEDLLQLSVSDVGPSEYEAEARKVWAQFIEEGVMEGGWPLQRRDGTVIATEFRARASILPGVHLTILRDVSERERAAQALMDSESRFRQVAELAPVIFWSSGTKPRLEFVSEQWPAFTGRTIDEELGSGWTSVLHPDDREGAVAQFVAAFESHKLYERQFRMRRFDGVYRWMLGRGTPRFSADGTFLGYIGTCTDIHELVEAREIAEEAARLKSALLTNMSHEIRTPLTAIIGFADILAEEIKDGHAELVEHIRLGAGRLYETLNSVLDFAQLEAGAAELAAESLDLGEVVREAASLYHARARHKGIDLILALQHPSPVVHVNRSAMNRVVANLLGNAIKFTTEGHVEVGVRGNGDSTQLWVADTGSGISSEFLPHLFDPFRQESEGAARNFEGNGLGLAITRKLVDAMGATIEVNSKKGTGSIFTVRLPADVEAQFPEVDAGYVGIASMAS